MVLASILVLLEGGVLSQTGGLRIQSITPQPARAPGDVITFRAEMDDPGGPAGDLVWTSDLDGVLGVTGGLVLVRDAAGLSPGTHTITLCLENGTGLRCASGSASLWVVAAPVVRLAVPPDGGGTVGFVPGEDEAQLELHRMVIESDVLAEVRIKAITYRPVPGTRLRGIKEPRLFVDLSGDGRAQEDEAVAPGVNNAEAILFRDLDLVLRTGAGLILGARVTPRALHGASVLVGPIVSFLLVLGILARARRRSGARRDARILVLLLLAALIAPEPGCRRRDDSVTLQLTLEETSDLEVMAADSGLPVEFEGFPAEGLAGPRVRVKRKHVSDSGL